MKIRSIRMAMISIFILKSCSISSASDNLKPLSEIAEPEDIVEVIYFMKRCAAVSIAIYPKMLPEDRPTALVLMKKYQKFSEMAFNLVVDLHKDAGGATIAQTSQIHKDIEDIMAIYVASMNESYLREGKTITNLIFDDTATCSYIYSNILNNK